MHKRFVMLRILLFFRPNRIKLHINCINQKLQETSSFYCLLQCYLNTKTGSGRQKLLLCCENSAHSFGFFIMGARLIMSLVSTKFRVSYYFFLCFEKSVRYYLDKILRIIFSTSYSYTLTFSLQAECFFYPSCAACFYFYRSPYIKFLLEAQLLPFHWEIVILKIL